MPDTWAGKSPVNRRMVLAEKSVVRGTLGQSVPSDDGFSFGAAGGGREKYLHVSSQRADFAASQFASQCATTTGRRERERNAILTGTGLEAKPPQPRKEPMVYHRI